MNAPTLTASHAQILTVAAAFFLEVLDATVMIVAIVPMANDINASISEVTLSLATYVLALAVFTPLSGYLFNPLGLAGKFQAGLLIFFVGSWVCALSPDLLTLCFARFIQGFGSALIVPAGRALILSYTPKHHMPRTMAWLIAPALTAPMAAPYIATLMLGAGGWRMIFVFVALLAVGLFIACRLWLRSLPSPLSQPSTLNRPAYALWSLFCGALFMVFVFSSTHQGYFAAIAAIWTLVGGALLTLTLRYARHTTLFDLTLLNNPLFKLNLMSGSLFRISIYTFPTLLIIGLMKDADASAVFTGHCLFFIFAGNLLAKPVAVKLLTGCRHLKPFFIGASLATTLSLGLFYNTRLIEEPITLWGLCFVHGCARSVQFLGYSTTSLWGIEQPRLHNATVLMSSVMQLNALIGQSVPALLAAFYMPDRWLTGESDGTFFQVGLATVTVLSLMTVLTAVCLPSAKRLSTPR